jgi:uncharacterized repeat protein (TIGR01451 family)
MTTLSRRTRATAPRISQWLTAGALALIVTLATAQAAGAQATPEGTVITNTATASYTDANGNTYTNATASVSVTVGFAAGVDVTSPASVSPASPSSGNQQDFTVNNTGNGTDQVSVGVTTAAGLTNVSYKYSGTTYPTLVALNAVLAGVNTTAGSSIIVSVLYDVASGRGGQTLPITLTATSVRTPLTSDASTTNVTPGTLGSVAVTPDGANVDRLPSNGTQYSQVFPVQNTGNASDVYNLAATVNPGTALAIVSVNGTAGASSTVSIASGATTNITVVYTVGNVAAGSTDQLSLTATSTNTPAQNDAGDVTVRVVKAALSMTKVAHRDNQTTVINNTTDRVLPGEFIQYKITVTNGGLASASTVSITDALPAAVTYNAASGDIPADWSISQVTGTVTATLTPALASTVSRFIWIRVQVK